MKKEVFFVEMKEKMEAINVLVSDEQLDQFYQYMNLLIEWNEKMNLTAIIEPKEIVLKHFVDSSTILEEIKDAKKVIDVGTGAGFPGIPIKILNEKIEVTLMDALNKRILFLEEVIKALSLKGIEAIHARAEELARQKNDRDGYDVVTSRAVASLNVLIEYMLPFAKVGGRCICMKGPEVAEEIKNSTNALKVLGGKIEKIKEIVLPDSDMKRTLIVIKKEKPTPKEYPRKAGKPSKEPIC